jgi:cytochrome c oxidase subunit 2
MTTAWLATAGATFWMPEQAARGAARIDFVFYYIYWVCVALTVITASALVWFMVRYRRRSETQQVTHITHNTPLELFWTAVPSVLMVPMFWWGFTGFLDARTPPRNTYDVNVVAKKWSWQFIYPNGYDDNHLHVPVNTPVKLVMQSEDVIHSLFIRAFRVKRDVVPGRYSFLWFEATRPGRFTLTCAEYCGQQHSDMRAEVIVHASREEFDDWLANADPFSERNMSPEEYQKYLDDPEAYVQAHPELSDKLAPPVEMGKRLYVKKGCVQCHSVDGSPNTGPTWKGVYGHAVQFRDGTSIAAADEQYLRESMIEPNKRVVRGFDAVMPPARVTQREMDHLIAYIKSLKD